MKIPFDIDKIEKIYFNNEEGKSGYYPIGTGSFWHSGIHINSSDKKEFEPLIPGTVVMYRIAKDYKYVDFPNEITESDLNTLFENNKKIYEKTRFNYTLKKSLSSDDKKFPVSNSFILMKHCLKIKQLTEEDCVFYTLYMNLAPISEYTKSCYDKSIIISDQIQYPAGDKKKVTLPKIGMPGLNNTERYFDMVVITEKNLFSYKENTKQSKKKLFFGINNKTTFYDQNKKNETIQNIYIPNNSTFSVAKFESGGKIAKKITLKTIRIYLPSSGIENEKVKNDIAAIWIGNKKISFESNISDQVDYLNENIKSIKGKKFAVKHLIETQPGIDVALEKYGKINYSFWVIDDGVSFTEEGQITESREYSTYTNNPLLHDYKQKDLSDVEKTTIIDIEKTEYKDEKNNVFYKVKDKNVFVGKADADKCFESAFDWNLWFLDYKENKGEKDDVFCNRTTVLEKSIDKHEEIRIKYSHFSIPLAIWWYGSYLAWTYLKGLFGNNEKYEFAPSMCGQLRKCACTHPLEWDKTQFADMKDKKKKKKWSGTISDTQAPFLAKVADNTDIWEGGLEKIFKTNILNFVHPVYFINHLERAGVFEFNPYENETIAGVKVVNNPGFAPYLGEGKGIHGYAPITWEFNGTSEGSSQHHPGIDFSIDIAQCGKMPIHSLINGTVIAVMDYKTVNWGKCLLIQSTEHPTYFYIVAHMSEQLVAKNESVSPGQKIGYVGNTGKMLSSYFMNNGELDTRPMQAINEADRKHGFGAHLHVQFVQSRNTQSIYDNFNNVFKKNVNSSSYNPIDYTIPWNPKEL